MPGGLDLTTRIKYNTLFTMTFDLGLSIDVLRRSPATLQQLLASWVVHDLGHLAQVARVMAKQYTEDVGPWMPFKPVLTDHTAPRS